MTAPATVRLATVEDAAAFNACHMACWREAYAILWGPARLDELDAEELAETRRREIAEGTARHVLAERDGEVLGVAIAGPSRDEDAPTELELYATYVRAAHQGSGVATALLDLVLEGKPASLWTYRDSPRASAFYVKNGFIPDGSERIDSSGSLTLRMIRKDSVPRTQDDQ